MNGTRAYFFFTMSTAEIDASWHRILIVALYGEIKYDASGVYVWIKKIKHSSI